MLFCFGVLWSCNSLANFNPTWYCVSVFLFQWNIGSFNSVIIPTSFSCFNRLYLFITFTGKGDYSDNPCLFSISSCHGNKHLEHIQTFQEKADDASVVVLILSELFATSHLCQKQVFIVKFSHMFKFCGFTCAVCQ